MSSTMFPRAHRFGVRGFTLIELMITVTIVAVLAAIAFPSYQDSVWKGKRTEAKAAIFKALQAEERYYTQNNAYVIYPPVPAGSGSFPVFSADNAANSRYTLAAVACGAGIATCVNVTATVSGNADPKCGTTLSMDSVGNKSSAIADPTCWK